MRHPVPAPVRLILLRHPFRQDREEVFAPLGQSLEDLAAGHGMTEGHVLCIVGGGLVRRELWRWITPKAGVEIILRRVPEKSGKNGLAALLSIASFFVPLAWGPELLAKGALFEGSAAVGLYGALAKGAIFLASSALSRPPAQRLGSAMGGGGGGTAYQVTGGSNKAVPYGPVPRVYGRHRVFPPYGANPYPETVGGKAYLNMIFDLGPGPLLFDDFRIGATPLANYDGVEMEVRAGYADDPALTLYRNDVAPTSLSILVTNAGGPRAIVTAQACDECTLDFAFFNGLFSAQEDGDIYPRNCIITVAHRLAGTSDPFINDGVMATFATLSTAVTLIGSTATSATYRTDNTTAGKVDLTLSMDFDKTYRVSTRKVGDTVWVQQAIVRHPDHATWQTGEPVPAAADTTVNLVVTVRAQCEILIAQDPADTTPAAPSIVSLSYRTYDTGSVVFNAGRASLVLASARIIFPTRGTYEVRVTRNSADDGSNTFTSSDMTWTGLNAITYENPITATGHALIALRIKATEQLNGVVQEFSCIASSLLPTWDGAAWTDPVETANPAWVYADILAGDANARPVGYDRLDTAALEAWADDCDAAGTEFNGVFDFRTTVFEAARDVAAAGRASFHMRDGLYSVIQDKAQTVPVQHFTPRNSWGYSASRRFVDLPHALKVRFLNADKDWQQDERIVVDDGYTEATATRFEVLELFGCTSADEAWKNGRRYIASARLRPEEHSFYADIEHIVCNRGDLIRISHDVPLFGLGFGRLKTVTLNGSSEATAATLDAAIVMEASGSYSLRIRRADGSSVVAAIATVAGEQTAVTFPTPIPAADAPAAGDLFLFGTTGSESVELVVTRVEPRADLSARITCVDHAPAVFTADSGEIPPWDSQISLPGSWARVPATPVIESVVSDERVLIITPDGGYQAVIQVVLSLPTGGAVAPVGVDVRWKIDGEDDWATLRLPPDAPILATLPGVTAGQVYAINARAVGALGEFSAWAATTHTVVGASTAPADVTNLLLRNGALMWSHEQPRDHAGYRVKFHAGTTTGWDSAAAAHLGLVTAAPFDISGLTGGGGTVTFLVKAVDLAGNESDGVATLTVGLGDAITDNVILTHDFHPTFDGTITNGTIDAGELEADNDGGLFWLSGSARFWGNTGSALFWAPGYIEMSYEFSLTPTLEQSGPGRILLSSAITGNGYAIDYKTTGSEGTFWGSGDFWSADTSALFWSASPDWTAWPGELTPIPPIEINWRVTCYAGLMQGRIATLSALIDVPDITEVLDDVAISSAGTTRLPITQSFRAITAVNLTLQDIATGARTVVAFDKDADLGPLVKAYDDTNTLVNASVDAIIQGY